MTRDVAYSAVEPNTPPSAAPAARDRVDSADTTV